MRPVLIDLDGVLRIKNEPADYLNEFIYFLTDNSFPSCILSNSSTSSAHHISQFFEKNSINLSIPVLTAIDAAKLYITGKYKRIAIYVSRDVVPLFTEFLDYENPEAVLIGDIGDMWNYEILQTIFDYIRNGAELIAAHKNKYWEKPNLGIQLDAGPFIHAIEYAASVTATLIGKPSLLYFQSALKTIDYDINTPFIMIGDDLDADIAGAKKIGAETILVYSGKTSPPVDSKYSMHIDHEANNLSDVIKILNEIG